MKYLALVVLFSFFLNSNAIGCENKPFITSQTGDGKSFGLFADAKYFKNAPEWNIASDEPPLSISSAVEIVNSWAESFYHKYDKVKIENIRIQSPWCMGDKAWVYVFTLQPEIDGNPVFGSQYLAAVTMSGELIEPREVESK
jgi:hypothetical protein